MNKRPNLPFREVLAFLHVGSFYWRLLILPFVGAFMGFITYLFSADMVDGNVGLTLSFAAIFYTVFLFALWHINSSFQGHLFAQKIIDLIVLWPLAKRTKFFWLYLRGTWLPAILLMVGAVPGVYFTHGGQAVRLLLPSLLYALAAAYFSSVFQWKGSFVVIDAGSPIGKFSVRQKSALTLVTFFVSLSPLILGLLSPAMKVIITVGFCALGYVYMGLSKHEMQVWGEGAHPSQTADEHRPRDLRHMAKAQNPAYRYFCFLEWGELRRPLTSLLIHAAGAFIQVTIFYVFVGGMFSINQEAPVHYHSLYLSLLVCTSTFAIATGSIIMDNNAQGTGLLLPLSPAKKTLVNIFRRILRPSVYTFFNIVVAALLLSMARWALSLFMPLTQMPFGQLTLQALRFAPVFILLTLTMQSLLELVLKTITLALQRAKFYQGANQFYSWGAFYLVTGLPIAIPIIISQDLSRLSFLLGLPAVILYLSVFFLCQLSLHFTMQKVQVLPS